MFLIYINLREWHCADWKCIIGWRNRSKGYDRLCMGSCS